MVRTSAPAKSNSKAGEAAPQPASKSTSSSSSDSSERHLRKKSNFSGRSDSASSSSETAEGVDTLGEYSDLEDEGSETSSKGRSTSDGGFGDPAENLAPKDRCKTPESIYSLDLERGGGSTPADNMAEVKDKVFEVEKIVDEVLAEAAAPVNDVDRMPDPFDKSTSTEMTMKDVSFLLRKLEELLEERSNLKKEVNHLNQILQEMRAKADKDSAEKLKLLQNQNAVLKEKSIEARKENDLLVEKIQRLQSRISTEVKVSVGDADDLESDDTFAMTSKSSSRQSPEAERPQKQESQEEQCKKSLYRRTQSCSGAGLPSCCHTHEDFARVEQKKFEEATEKIMRLEQRILCLQNANNLNSCATCRPLRKHVMKIEKQLVSLVQERRGQLEELFELKQEALSSAVSEKDAHLAWLEVTGEGNVHTRGTIDKLKKERRELLNRMKEENENRTKLLASLEESSALFTGPTKLATILALGDSYVDDGVQSTSSLQSESTTGSVADIRFNPVLYLSPSPSCTEELGGRFSGSFMSPALVPEDQGQPPEDLALVGHVPPNPPM